MRGASVRGASGVIAAATLRGRGVMAAWEGCQGRRCGVVGASKGRHCGVRRASARRGSGVIAAAKLRGRRLTAA